MKTRHNVMSINTLTAFSQIKGGYTAECRDVYFIRFLGINDRFIDELLKTDGIPGSKLECGDIIYKRINRLPAADTRDVLYYSQKYNLWKENGEKQLIIKASEKNPPFSEALGQAMHDVCVKYSKEKKNISDSIIKNFCIKLMNWTDYVIGSVHTEWNCRSCIKVVADNVVKLQEYLFYYFLTLVGIDVALIQSSQDIEVSVKSKGGSDRTDKDGLAALSYSVHIGDFKECKIPEYRESQKVQSVINRSTAVKKDTAGQNTAAGQKHTADRKSNANKKDSNTSEKNFVAGAGKGNTGAIKKNKQSSREEKSMEELALLAESVVMIAIHDKRGEIIGTGSGIMIGKKGYILTNNHVVTEGMFFSVRIENEDKIYQTDEIIKYNRNMDLAIIRIDRELKPIPVYNGQKLARGQKVVAIGSPLGLFNTVSDGIISGFRYMDDIGMIQFTAPTSHGSSGGAVLNMNGEIIGISTAGMEEGQNLNLAVPYDYINTFIRGFV